MQRGRLTTQLTIRETESKKKKHKKKNDNKGGQTSSWVGKHSANEG